MSRRAYIFLLLAFGCGLNVFAESHSFSIQHVKSNIHCNSTGKQDHTIPLTDTFSFALEKTIPGDFQYMTTDVLGNLYVITNGNRLYKLNANGDSAGVFNDVKKYGNPAYIDVSNPLKVIVYYRNFSTAVILDRFLSHRNTIDFRKLQIFKLKAIANSYDNQLWVFDEQDFKLKKVSDDGRLMQESADLRIVLDSVPSVLHIVDQDNLVYLYDPEKGFYIFDYYGAWKNRIPLLGWTNVAVSGKKIYGFTGNILQMYELNTLQQQSVVLPEYMIRSQSIRISMGKLYLLTDKGVEIYEIR
jgi:hypothetical protein